MDGDNRSGLRGRKKRRCCRWREGMEENVGRDPRATELNSRSKTLTSEVFGKLFSSI